MEDIITDIAIPMQQRAKPRMVKQKVKTEKSTQGYVVKMV